MANSITIHQDEREWEGYGDFRSSQTDFSNFSNWMNNITMEFRNVVDRYDAAMSDDGRIDIAEKSHIVKELDEFMNCLTALRFHLVEPNERFSVENKKFGFAYSIEKDGEGWKGEGRFTKKYKIRMEKFSSWYEKVMLKQFQTLSETYKKVTADEFIDNQEREQLFAIVDVFFFEILLVRNFIHRREWTE